MIETIYSNPELYHSGVKGQKWGRRRYQNPDGTWTEEGKRRRRIGDDDNYEPRTRRPINRGKAIAVGLGVAGGALAAYKIAKDPKKAYEYFKKKAAAAGDAMVDAALVSIGTLAITKLASELNSNGAQSEGEKAANKVLLDMGSAGIRSITNSKYNSNKNKNNSNSNNDNKNKNNQPMDSSQKEAIIRAVGAPSGDIDRQSEAYQNLFKDVDDQTRNTIKRMAKEGFDVGQIEEYLHLLDLDDPPF